MTTHTGVRTGAGCRRPTKSSDKEATMRLRTAYDRGFLDGFRQGWQEVADAAAYAASHASAATTAGQMWLVDLAGHARRLGRATAAQAPPPEAELLRTPSHQVRAATGHLAPARARQAAHRYGLADGRIAAIGAAARDLYLAARQDLGNLRPAIDGRPAHLWLETARLGWLDLAGRGPAPIPGTRAAQARSTLTGGATPGQARGEPPTATARSVQRVARPAPAAAAQAGQAATSTRGVARVPYRPAARR